MLHHDSTEVRWFFAGEVSAAMRAAFVGERGLVGATRVDVYVRSSDENLGVKLREGKIEVKTRDAVAPLGGGISGAVETWTKWGWKIDGLPGGRESGSSWIEVRKVRYQHKYRWIGDAIEFQIDGPVERGGAIELTELEVRGQHHWTLAAEAYEHGRDAQNMVEQAAKQMQDRLGSTVLAGARSLGYPAWLPGLAPG